MRDTPSRCCSDADRRRFHTDWATAGRITIALLSGLTAHGVSGSPAAGGDVMPDAHRHSRIRSWAFQHHICPTDAAMVASRPYRHFRHVIGARNVVACELFSSRATDRIGDGATAWCFMVAGDRSSTQLSCIGPSDVRGCASSRAMSLMDAVGHLVRNVCLSRPRPSTTHQCSRCRLELRPNGEYAVRGNTGAATLAMQQ